MVVKGANPTRQYLCLRAMPGRGELGSFPSSGQGATADTWGMELALQDAPALECRLGMFFVVGYVELAAYLSRILGFPLSGGDILEAEDLRNHTYNRYVVGDAAACEWGFSPQSWRARREDDGRVVQGFLEARRQTKYLEALLNCLAARGRLAAGTYLVEVHWAASW